jgi:hypothetical protein
LTASVFSSKPLFHFQHVLRIILIHAIILPVGFVVAKWIALFHEFCADTDVGVAVDSIGSGEKAGFEPRSPSSRPSPHPPSLRYGATSGRRRIIRRPLENSRDWICRTLILKTKTGQPPFPLLGERIKGEGGRKTQIQFCHFRQRIPTSIKKAAFVSEGRCEFASI